MRDISRKTVSENRIYFRGCASMLFVGAQPLFVEKENPAFDAGFRERYAFDQKSSNR